MPVISEAQRLPTLARLGLSPHLLAIASGDQVPHELETNCRAISKVYIDGDASLDDGPAGCLTVPLWERGTTITAVREDSGGLTFCSYNLEDEVQHAEVIARTEQGLWAHVFVTLIEDEEDGLVDLARTVGFRYFALIEDRYAAVPHSTWDQHHQFLTALIAEIDALERAG